MKEERKTSIFGEKFRTIRKEIGISQIEMDELLNQKDITQSLEVGRCINNKQKREAIELLSRLLEKQLKEMTYIKESDLSWKN